MTNRPEWLGMLAKLVTPGDPAKAFRAMEAFLPFLAELPDAAFTLASLEAVAMTPRRLHIPDLSEVKGPLVAHWRDSKPARPALPAPAFRPQTERAAPTADVRAYVARQLAELAKDLGGTRREPEPAQQIAKPNYAPPVQLAEARAALAARAQAARA